MTPAPLVLAEAANLYTDGICTVWHSGAVIGPPGILVVNLYFDWVEPSDWRDHVPTDAQPVHAHLEIPKDDAEHILGDNSYAGGFYNLTYTAIFPGKVRGKSAFPPLTQEQVLGATLEIDASYVIGQQFTIGPFSLADKSGSPTSGTAVAGDESLLHV